jgi:hypothetical protein
MIFLNCLKSFKNYDIVYLIIGGVYEENKIFN